MYTTLDEILQKQRNPYLQDGTDGTDGTVENYTLTPAAQPAAQPEAQPEAQPAEDSWLDSPYMIKNYSEEQRNAVRNAVRKVNPDDGLAAEQYVKIFQKPELDEKALKRKQAAAMLGDGIKIFAQMFGAASGVKIDRIDPSQTLAEQNSRKEDEMRKLYQKRKDAWDTGYFGILQQEKKQRNDRAAALEKQMRDDAKYGENLERQQERYDDAAAREAERYADTKEHRDAVFAEQQKQNKINNSLSVQRLAMQKEAKRGSGKQEKPVPLRGEKGSLDIPEALWKSIYPALAVEISGTGKLPSSKGKQMAQKEPEACVMGNIDKIGYGGWHEIRKFAGMDAGGLPKGLVDNMENIVKANPGNDDYAAYMLEKYLKSENFTQEEAWEILKLIFKPDK